MASVKFEIYENGNVVQFENYSGQELASLQDTLDKLVDIPGKWDKVAKCWEKPYYFVKVTLPEEGSSGIITFMNMETQHPINVPTPWLEKFLGKTIQIEPKQYGLSSWPGKVEVKFISLSKIRIREEV